MKAAIHTRRQVLMAVAAAAFVLLGSMTAAQELAQQLPQHSGRSLSSASGSGVKKMAKDMPKMSEASDLLLKDLHRPEGTSGLLERSMGQMLHGQVIYGMQCGLKRRQSHRHEFQCCASSRSAQWHAVDMHYSSSQRVHPRLEHKSILARPNI